MYDAIIVGAGPAGALLAKKLADAGLKTLVVEKKKLPRHKMCSGIISSFSQRILKKEFGKFPEVLCCYPKKSKGMEVYPTKMDPPQKLRENSFNVWRSDFDFWLNTKASEAGAEIEDQTELLSFSDQTDSIEVSLKTRSGMQKQQGRFLIGADGGTSLIRRTLFKLDRMRWFSVYQTYWKGESNFDPDYFHAFLDREFTEFFAWFNVKGGQRGIYQICGTAAEKGSMVPEYFNRFQEYLEEAHGFRGEKLLFREACTAPIFFDPKYEYRFGEGNILLVGESAGLFNVFAEGISPALQSALDASNAILQGGPDVLDNYKMQVQPLCNSLKIGWEGLLKIFPNFLALK